MHTGADKLNPGQYAPDNYWLQQNLAPSISLKCGYAKVMLTMPSVAGNGDHQERDPELIKRNLIRGYFTVGQVFQVKWQQIVIVVMMTLNWK